MRHILQICHLVTFRISTIEISIEKPFLRWYSGLSLGRDKTALQHSRKLFSGLLQRPPKTLEAAYRRGRKLFRRRSLAAECKCTILFSIPLVSELSGHRLYVCVYIYILVYFPPTHLHGLVFIMDTDNFSLTYEMNPYINLDTCHRSKRKINCPES